MTWHGQTVSFARAALSRRSGRGSTTSLSAAIVSSRRWLAEVLALLCRVAQDLLASGSEREIAALTWGFVRIVAYLAHLARE